MTPPPVLMTMRPLPLQLSLMTLRLIERYPPAAAAAAAQQMAPHQDQRNGAQWRRCRLGERRQRWIRGACVWINRVRLIASTERGHYGESAR